MFGDILKIVVAVIIVTLVITLIIGSFASTIKEEKNKLATNTKKEKEHADFERILKNMGFEGFSTDAVYILLELGNKRDAELVYRIGNGSTIGYADILNRIETGGAALNRILRTVKPVLEKHGGILGVKREEKIYTDEFGDERIGSWTSYLSNYYNEKLVPIIDSIDLDIVRQSKYIEYNEDSLKKAIIKEVEFVVSSIEHDFAYSPNMQGTEYEAYCADRLVKNDWAVSKTPATGDRGADLIAKKGNLSVAIQCKRFSKPVGNMAIQEVHAAKGIYNTVHAVVVTNNIFTKQAREDARKLEVTLVENNQLENIEHL